MTTEYLDALIWKKTRQGKTLAIRIGSAKTLDNGNINVYLDALPMPGPDGCQITIAKQRDKKPAADKDLNDEIPF